MSNVTRLPVGSRKVSTDTRALVRARELLREIKARPVDMGGISPEAYATAKALETHLAALSARPIGRQVVLHARNLLNRLEQEPLNLGEVSNEGLVHMSDLVDAIRDLLRPQPLL